MATERKAKLDREMESFFFPITENHIRELRSRSRCGPTASAVEGPSTLSAWSPSPVKRVPEEVPSASPGKEKTSVQPRQSARRTERVTQETKPRAGSRNVQEYVSQM